MQSRVIWRRLAPVCGPTSRCCCVLGDKGVSMSYKSSLTVLWMIATAACLSALAGCASMSVGSDYDRAASFTQLRTFVMLQREHKDVQNPLTATRAEDAIREELVRRGYQQTNDRAS